MEEARDKMETSAGIPAAEKPNMNHWKKPELLIPAGSPEVLRTAVRYGADAVYLGGDAFGLRAKAHNFSLAEMNESIGFAHAHGVKVHVTVNILAHNYDFPGVEAYLKELAALENRPDALIIADPGIFTLAGKFCPGIERHISTQANNTNYETFNFWRRLGADRVVCARELSLAEIRDIRAKTDPDLAIEAFVHGAMCISYSGRCLLSNYMTGRDANRGLCTHPCRWKYALMEETRPGEYFPVEENERGTFIMNSRDLSMIEHIPELVDAGIDSFKIEGRMKTALYVGTVARTYRRAIDDYFEDPALYEAHMPWYREEIRRCTYREFTTGFYFGKPDENSMVYGNNTYDSDAVYLGRVEEVTKGVPAAAPRILPAAEEAAKKRAADGTISVRFEQKNKFSAGDRIEVMKPDGRDLAFLVDGFLTADGTPQESAPHPQQILWAKLRTADGTVPAAEDLPEPGDLFRKNL